MANPKGFLDKSIDLLEKIMTITATFTGAQIAFWIAYLVSKEQSVPDYLIILGMCGICCSLILIAVLLIQLFRKVRQYGELK